MNRRRFINSMSIASAGFTLPGYLAEAVTLTPAQVQGPFYPLADDIPLDKDNDLVKINDHLTVASGIVTHVSGRILDRNENPIRGALVELWHADSRGEYTYSTKPGPNIKSDPNFAGFGQSLTGSSGAYRFRTIKPGLYPGRARHFHWGITIPGQKRRFSTQTYWQGETLNKIDFLLNSIENADQRNSIVLPFDKVPEALGLEEQASWDFVSQYTPIESEYPLQGGLKIKGSEVLHPIGGSRRFRINVPVFKGYTYEIYSNPSLRKLDWKLLPFSISQNGLIDRNQYTSINDEIIRFYVDVKTNNGMFFVSYRLPGSNKGTP